MDKKFQIFISSTYTDLIEERRIVQDTILSMYHFPVGMELFSAADEDQWDVIKETIDSSDYYVLLVAHRYGSVIQSGPDAGISYTEKEYRYAKEQGIPILAFLIDGSVTVKPENIEREHIKELDAFIQDVKTGRIVKWWKTKEELASLVMNALYKQFGGKNKRPGWVRDTYDAESTLAEVVKLNQQIRDLTDENRKLKEELAVFQKPDRAPKLTVSINVDTIDDELGNACHPEYAIQDEDTFIQGIKVFDVALQVKEGRYSPLTKEDFPSNLVQFARQDEIDAYNNGLPSQEMIDAYLEQMKNYVQASKCSVHVNIGIHNDGTAKASSVSATIEFPEGVAVYDEDDILDIAEPAAPKTAKNPIELAKKRAEQQMKFALDMNSTIDFSAITSQLGSYTPSHGLYDIIKKSNVDYTLFDNELEIECGDVIHTKSHWRRGIFLVGKKAGKYQIKCTLMCEEYSEPQVEYIDFEVV